MTELTPEEEIQIDRSMKEFELTTNIKTQIRKKLDSIKISIRGLEKRAGLYPGTISNIMKGSSANPTAVTLNSLANAFECSVDELLNREEYFKEKQDQYLEAAFLRKQPWNAALYSAISNELTKQLNKTNTTISSEKAMRIIQDLYIFLFKNNKDTIDETLISWLLATTK